MNVLIVEDDEFSRTILERMLAKNFNCYTAENGIKAIELMHSGIDIDVVVTDNNMPEMSGDELMKHIKSCEMHKHIPILIASGDEEHLIKNIELADRHFNKPIDIKEMRKHIDNLR
jgi:CheY-like chemotaxis protein